MEEPASASPHSPFPQGPAGGESPARGAEPASGGMGHPRHPDRARVRLHGGGGARAARQPATPATPHFRHPRVPETGGVRVDRGSSGNAWITREPARRPQAGGSRTRDRSPGIGRRASTPREGTPRARAEGPGPSQGPFARGLRVHISPVAQNVDLWRKNYRVRRRRLATDPSGLPGTGLGPPDPGHHPIPASDRSGWATWSTPEAGEPRRQARRATRRDEMRYSPLQRSQARAGAATNYRASELGLGEGA